MAAILFEVLHDWPTEDSTIGVLNKYPTIPGLLPWGGDDQGGTFYWIVDGPPDSWKTAAGRGQLHVFDTPMTQFLLSCLTTGIIYFRGCPKLDYGDMFFFGSPQRESEGG
jgi:hypothetical protein